MANSNPTDLQHVLVTGGTSGIGLALAKGMADAGWSVTAAGLNPDESRFEAERIAIAELDVTDQAAIEALVHRLPRLDAVVNAAGIIARRAEYQPDIFTSVVNVNLIGCMRVCSAAHPRLAVHGGSIVNIASMLSYFGGGLVPGYAASKGGVAQLTKSLAIGWAADGIRVNAIAPGWIETSMTAGLRADPKREQAILSRTPLNRWGRPEEMVGPVLFLTSPAASFVTGTILNVDGGYACC